MYVNYVRRDNKVTDLEKTQNGKLGRVKKSNSGKTLE